METSANIAFCLLALIAFLAIIFWLLFNYTGRMKDSREHLFKEAYASLEALRNDYKDGPEDDRHFANKNINKAIDYLVELETITKS